MAKNAHGAPVDIEVAGRTVTISSPLKVMFPERGETKLDLANYYLSVGDGILERPERGGPRRERRTAGG